VALVLSRSPVASPRPIGGLLLAAALAVLPCRAAKLPEHVIDQPIETSLYPLTHIRSEAEKIVNDTFLAAKSKGLEPFVSYWGTYLANPVGGEQHGTAWAQLLVFGGEIHFDGLGWQGGSLFISATDFAGSNLSQKIGNAFTVSQAVVTDGFSFYDLYLKQTFWNDALEFRVGRFAAGQLFATLPAMGLPVSGAVNGNPTSLFTNAPFHSTAAASWAAYTKYMPTPSTYTQAGIFQATPQSTVPANHGLNFRFNPGDGELIMAEAGWLPNFGATPEKTAATSDGKKVVTPAKPGLAGQYNFGAYYSNYTFPTFNGGVEHNAYGLYGEGQQMVWRSARNSSHYFTVWSGITFSPQQEFAQIPVMGYGGIIWQGLVPSRDQDQLLLNYYIGGFSHDYARQTAESGSGWATVETDLEASYVVQISENLSVQPDLQWIINPGGLRAIPNALVLGFQVSAIF